MQSYETKLTENFVKTELLKIRTQQQLNYFKSYGVNDLFELYEYLFGYRSICECSMELQCAVFEGNEEAYAEYVDEYYINKSSPWRLSEALSFLSWNYDDISKQINNINMF